MEFYSGGSLLEKLSTSLPEEKILKIVIQILSVAQAFNPQDLYTKYIPLLHPLPRPFFFLPSSPSSFSSCISFLLLVLLLLSLRLLLLLLPLLLLPPPSPLFSSSSSLHLILLLLSPPSPSRSFSFFPFPH